MYLNKFVKSKIAISAVCALVLGSSSAFAVAFKPAPTPKGTNLGYVKVNPYGNSPLTAIIDLKGKTISDVKVLVHGKGKNGIDIEYDVGRANLLTHDGVPIFGMYPNHLNEVTVSYKDEAGKKYKDNYKIATGGIENKYLDSRDTRGIPEIKMKKVDGKFKDKLFLTNTHQMPVEGTVMSWVGQLPPDANLFASAPPTGGSIPFDSAPLTFITDTEGEIRWWLNQDSVYDSGDRDMDKIGYLMGISETKNGTFTFLQGQTWGEFDMLGKILYQHQLPRGYIDASHDMTEMPNGNILLRAAKANYVRPDGQVVHTVRDHILELDKTGRLLDVWDLNKILDPNRDTLLKGLDVGAVCLNVDLDNRGKTLEVEPDAPFGDIAGIGPGRNWAHTNSVDYIPSDDSIVLSLRHQGTVKIGRDKEVDWIMTPRAGWKGELAKKVLQPVNSKGQKIECTDMGVCDDPKFEYSYTQHTSWLSPTGTYTILDNGDGRYNEQPAIPTDKYTRFVEYKVDEKDMTVQQLWEYGRERGYEWYSPVTSNVELVINDGPAYMYGFNGSVGLFDGKAVRGVHNIVDYNTGKVMVEFDVLSTRPGGIHYRGVMVNPDTIFSK